MGNRKLDKKTYYSLSLVAMGQTRFWSLSCSIISGDARIKIWLILIPEVYPRNGNFVLGLYVFCVWAGWKWLTVWRYVQSRCNILYYRSRFSKKYQLNKYKYIHISYRYEKFTYFPLDSMYFFWFKKKFFRRCETGCWFVLPCLLSIKQCGQNGYLCNFFNISLLWEYL